MNNETRLSAACILKGESTRGAWDEMTKIWFHQCLAYLDSISHDQGLQFISKEWNRFLRINYITEKSYGVESHSAIGASERYYLFRRDVYRKIAADNPTLTP